MPRQSRHRFDLGRAAAIATMVLFVPLLAAVNAFIGLYAAIPYVALAAAVAFFALPLDFLLLACFATATVLAGLIDYFGNISQGFWLPYLMGALFALRGVAEQLRLGTSSRQMSARGVKRATTPPHPVTWLAAVYLAIAGFGLVVALPPLPQVIVAIKNYFFLWGVLFMLVWSPWRVASSNRFWSALVVVACLQWPVALYQRIFIRAAGRSVVARLDSVVGTFGGQPDGGGNSAAMAFLCCLAVGVLVVRMREKRIGVMLGAFLIILCIIPIALAEVKAAFIWIVVVFLVINIRLIRREPLRASISLLMGALLLGGLGLVYKEAYRESGTKVTFENFYESTIKYSVDPAEYSARFHRLGRITSIVFWWKHHDLRSDSLSMLIGHGIGSSRSKSSMGQGEIARELQPIFPDTTAASTLLWDVGLLGALSFVAMLAVAGLSAIKASQRRELDVFWRETTLMSACVLSMAILGVLYNVDPIDNPTVQILIFFAIGQVLLVRREIARVGSAPPLPVMEPAFRRGVSRVVSTAAR